MNAVCTNFDVRCSSLYTLSGFMLCSQRIMESRIPPPAQPRREISGQQYRPVAPGWCRGSSILGVGPRHAPGICVDQTEHCAHLCSVRGLRVSPSRRQSRKRKERKGSAGRQTIRLTLLFLREKRCLCPTSQYLPFFAMQVRHERRSMWRIVDSFPQWF